MNQQVSQQGVITEQDVKSGRRHFIALTLVIGLPFAVALYLIYNLDVLEGIATKNKGYLVQPTREIPTLEFQTLDGGIFDTKSFQGTWTLLLAVDSQCDDGCQKNLFYQRQIRLATGDDRSRVNRVTLLLDKEAIDSFAKKVEPFKTQVLIGPEASREALLKTLMIDDQPMHGRMFTIDPQGRLVLGYDANPAWKDVLHDLQHLLKVVQF